MLRIIISNNKLMFGTLFIFFILFSGTLILALYYADKSTSVLRKKNQTYIDQIISSTWHPLMAHDYKAVEEFARPFCTSDEISSIKIYDSEKKEVYHCVKNANTAFRLNKEFIMEENIIAYYEVGIIDLSLLSTAGNLAAEIVNSTLFNLWNYDTSAIERISAYYFSNPDIAELSIKDTSGFRIAEFKRKYPANSIITVNRDYNFNGREIGTLNLSLSSINKERVQHYFNITLRGSIFALAFMLLITPFIVYRIRTNYIDAYLKYSSGHEEHGSIIQTSSWRITEIIEKKILRVIAYIRSNFERDISREGLAQIAELNADNLGRYFKIYTGKRIQEYIYTLRINKAASELAETSKPISEIARDSGFEHIGTFYRTFSSIMKITPADFRKIGQNGSRKQKKQISNKTDNLDC